MTCPICAWVASLYWRQNSMMFTPCWPRAVPTGGAGVACPALIWSLTMAVIFLRLRCAGGASGMSLPPAVQAAGVEPASRRWSGLRHLVEGELDRRFPVEDVHQHFELGLLYVDLGDGPLEVGERARDDPHGVAFLPLQPVFGLLLGLGLDGKDLLDLAGRERRGLGPGAARHEPGDTWSVSAHVPGIVVVHHLDEQVSRKHLLLNDLLLSGLDLHHVFHGDDDVKDLVFHLHGVDAGPKVCLHLVLVAGISMHHVPLPRPGQR